MMDQEEYLNSESQPQEHRSCVLAGDLDSESGITEE